MMGLGVMRNEVLEGKYGKAGSRRRGREERKGHVRLHSWRWGGRREESSDEESDMEEGRDGRGDEQSELNRGRGRERGRES